jgi:prepilin-type N-terminal cleavage/methylation domain-containing protein
MSVNARGSMAPGMVRQRGFSLLEMAIVLVIIGLLLGGLVGSFGSLQARQREEQTRHQLEEIREALITFAVVNRRLPCPASPAIPDTVAGAGFEQIPTAAGCTGGAAGVLPWGTLGLSETDAWGRRFTYRVTPGFSHSGTAITLASLGDNTIRNRAGVVLATQVSAVIISHGANAFGSRGRSGTLAPGSANAFEQENANNDVNFVADTPTATFDDLSIWVPSSILMSRMLQAGVLP